jgi:hypothetical protein
MAQITTIEGLGTIHQYTPNVQPSGASITKTKPTPPIANMASSRAQIPVDDSPSILDIIFPWGAAAKKAGEAIGLSPSSAGGGGIITLPKTGSASTGTAASSAPSSFPSVASDDTFDLPVVGAVPKVAVYAVGGILAVALAYKATR